MPRIGLLVVVGLLIAGCGDDGGPTPDESPPAILETEPAADATGVDRNTKIRVYFDEAVDNSRMVWDDQLHLVNDQGQPMYGNGSYDLEQHVATLSLVFELMAGHTYEAVLERGVCDMLSNCTTEAYSWSFTAAQ